MKRKMIVALVIVSIGLYLMGITQVLAQEVKIYNTIADYEKASGGKIERFYGAPMLRAKVAAGELPPVEERLPEVPLVVVPYEEVGLYGGSLHAISDYAGSGGAIFTMVPSVFHWSNDCTQILPSYGTDYEFSEDKKTITIHLRKGMKWSDGVPFTADDVLFWWEDIVLNEELTPVNTWHALAGELPKVEKIDNYTVRFAYASSAGPRIGHYICIFAFRGDPKHYLKKWHKKYNPEADDIAKEEGFDHWWQAFAYHQDMWVAQQDVNLPGIGPWLLKKATGTQRTYERNPYYWKIDTAGNQLPYADKIIVDIVTDQEMVTMKILAGEIDFVGMTGLSLENYPLLKENAEKGEYRVFLYNSTNGANLVLLPNLNHEDPVLRETLQDRRFRQALSLAIDRNELNDMIYLGTGIPRQLAILPNASYYKEEWGKAYAEYNPIGAGQLLDEMGLKWDSEHQWRLGIDGKPLALNIEFSQALTPRITALELIKEYWEKIGIKITLSPEGADLYWQRKLASKHDIGVWQADRCLEGRVYAQPPYGDHSNWYSAREWERWFDTQGETGQEPSEVMKECKRLLDAWQTTIFGSEEYKSMAQELFDLYAESIWAIGTVGGAKLPIVVAEDLRNVPEQGYFGCDNDWWASFLAEQWFFKRK